MNAKISCKCRNELHLALRTVVHVFSVQSEGKQVCGLQILTMLLVVISRHTEKKGW